VASWVAARVHRPSLCPPPFPQVADVSGTFRWGPFLPVQLGEDNLLTLLLLTSKYRLKVVPVVEAGHGQLRNLITQSAIVRFLADSRGADWYDTVANKSLTQVGWGMQTRLGVTGMGLQRQLGGEGNTTSRTFELLMHLRIWRLSCAFWGATMDGGSDQMSIPPRVSATTLVANFPLPSAQSNSEQDVQTVWQS
jgi:hypothetical protein